MRPTLTVLMTVFNGEPYLPTAIESVLGQTYRDFRFLVIDDASTDRSRAVVRSYADDRIELVCLPRNVGQTAALNVGLRQARTPWIARMDADDYSAPTRLEKQMRALEADPELVCVGTYAWAFIHDPGVVEAITVRPVTGAEIERRLLVGPPMIHGSLVVNREALLAVGGYDERYRYSADLEMYDRLLRTHHAVNIPEPLLGVRRHEGKGSITVRALDENVSIFRRRLANGAYSPAERRIVQEALSRIYLHRARVRKDGYRSVADYACALWLRPRWLIAAARRIVHREGSR